MADMDEIRLSLNSLEDLIPQVELILNGEVIPECLGIFSTWFVNYSTEGKMYREDCARFLRDVTSKDGIGKGKMPATDDPRINQVYETYDPNNNGFLEKEGFVSFYKNCTITSKREIVWENLRAMGVRNDLKMVSISVF